VSEMRQSFRRVVAPDAATSALQGRGAVTVGTGASTSSLLEARARGLRRSEELMKAIGTLDAQPSAEAAAAVMRWIREEYDARGGGMLAGLFGRCYLGAPYVDHVMTLSGEICEHYTSADAVPAMYGAARALAANPAYQYVEVYTDGAVVPIRPDGSAVT